MQVVPGVHTLTPLMLVFQMVCELLLERGDYVLAEEYTYPSVIESVIIPKGYKPLGVKLDQDGIRPESLLEVAHRMLTLAAMPT